MLRKIHFPHTFLFVTEDKIDPLVQLTWHDRISDSSAWEKRRDT